MNFQTARSLSIASSETESKIIGQAVEDILQSSPFRATRQCQNLLRYVVNHSLVGEDQLLRERIIGIEVFGRKPDYDTAEDPIVRIRAADLRRRLAQYYQRLNSTQTRVRIDVPSGSYRATFEWAELAAQDKDQAGTIPLAASMVEPDPPVLATESRLSSLDPSRVRLWKRLWITAPLVMLLFLVPLFVRKVPQRPEQDFNLFWSPLLSSSKPILVCVGTNAVYRLSDNFIDQYRESHHLADPGRELFLDLSSTAQLKTADLVPQPNTFVGVADMAATTQIVALLARRSRMYQQRFAGDIEFGDLRHTPAVLVGGFSNSWTMEMMSDLPFVLAKQGQIVDRQKKNVWSIKRSPDGITTDDYAVVSRILNAKNDDVLLILAGIGSYGTQAAGEFVSDPQMIALLAKTAPPGWNKRNLQVVLHIHVVHLAPSTVEIAAVYSW